MFIRATISGIASALLGVLLVANVYANQYMYRYTDADGVVVINYQVPPELVHKGYQVITSDGDVIRTVKAFDPDNILDEDEISAMEKQRKHDLLMLRSFSTVDDLWANRDRKLSALRREVIGIKNSIRDYQRLLSEEEKRAANRQRAGQAVSTVLSSHIQRLSEQLEEAKVALTARTEELEAAKEYYRQQEERFRLLKGIEG